MNTKQSNGGLSKDLDYFAFSPLRRAEQLDSMGGEVDQHCSSPMGRHVVCAGAPDARRGQIVKAFVVLRAGVVADAACVMALQDFVKASGDIQLGADKLGGWGIVINSDPREQSDRMDEV